MICWRFPSDRHSLPCPSWLSWLVELDNPCSEMIAHVISSNTEGLQLGMKVLDFERGSVRLIIPIAKQIGTARLNKISDALRPGGILSITEELLPPSSRVACAFFAGRMLLAWWQKASLEIKNPLRSILKSHQTLLRHRIFRF